MKRRCQKWPCMSHSDICSTSYVRKKGRESNCQFDSRPLKVGNRLDFLVYRRRETYRWKYLDEGYNFALDLIVIGGLHKKLCTLKVVGVPTVAISAKKPFGCGPRGVTQSILYGGRWWLPPSPGCGESSESIVACGLSQHQGCSIMWTNQLVGWFDAGSSKWIASPSS